MTTTPDDFRPYLARVFGPAWQGLGEEARADLASDAYLAWLVAAPPGSPLTPEPALAAARQVRQQNRARLEREVGLGQFSGDEAVAPEAGESTTPTLDGLLAQWARDPTKQQTALFLRLHLGTRVYSTQPRALLSPQPERNLRRYHPKQSGPGCPTCRTIARVVRTSPRLSAQAVGNRVDQAILDLYALREGGT
jgi:hypothetical protein